MDNENLSIFDSPWEFIQNELNLRPSIYVGRKINDLTATRSNKKRDYSHTLETSQ